MIQFDESALEKLPKILKIANEMPPEIGKTLIRSLDFLANYGDGTCIAKLYSDFAPLSLGFTIFQNKSQLFNGALIYQGPDSPANGDFPSLTVSLNDKIGWFIHT